MGRRESIVDASDLRRVGPPLPKKPRAREESGPRFTLEPHVCRHCFGRLLSSGDATGRVYLCSNCGRSASGDGPDVLCACGLKLRHHGPGSDLVSAGLRCQPNPAPTAAFPSLFVACEPVP